MTDLVAEIKARLTVQDVIARSYKLRPHGHNWTAFDPDGAPGERKKSLTVDTRKQLWFWFAKGAGGDVLAWIAYQRFNRTKVDGEQFKEVLREGCALAGIEYVEGDRGEGAAVRDQRRQLEKEKRAILAAYLQVAIEAWTPLQMERARQIGRVPHDPERRGKVYLTPAAIEKHGLGCAPSVEACLKAGLAEKDLRLVGLLRDPWRQGPDEQPYMHFRDSILIPWYDGGEVVFISSRRFKDYAGDGTALPKEKKSLSMYAPNDEGRGGMERPCAYNLETLRALFDPALQKSAEARELLIVEGPLDAIACEEQGHAAIALGCTSPTAELVKRLAYYPQVIKYLALDGTKDVTGLSRAQAAGVLGYYMRVCTLPAEQDPDDMTGEQLAALKAASVDVLDAWLALVA